MSTDLVQGTDLTRPRITCELMCGFSPDSLWAVIHLHRIRGSRLSQFTQPLLTFWHRSFTFNSNKSPTRFNNFSVYYPGICLQLNMFRAFSRPSSGAQWLQWQPLVLPSYRGDSRAVFVTKNQMAGAYPKNGQARPTRKLLDWKPMGTRPVGKPRQRWQEDVMEDLKKLKVKPGRRHLRKELGETWLRRRKPTKSCSAKWWWWWWWWRTVNHNYSLKQSLYMYFYNTWWWLLLKQNMLHNIH